MQECRDEDIVPKDRHSAESSALLWTRAVRIFSLLSLLISWRLRIFRMNLLRLSCYQGRTNQNRQALYQHQPLLLFLVGLDCQRWCYLRFCNLQNAQKGKFLTRPTLARRDAPCTTQGRIENLPTPYTLLKGSGRGCPLLRASMIFPS